MQISLIPAFNPGPYTGEGNNTYLIHGREPVLVDAGAGRPQHLDRIADALGQHAGLLARVLVTHAHSDHAGGCRALAARWPDAEFFKMPWQGLDERYGVLWCPLADGDLVPAGDGALRVIHTPGHAPDHLCFFDEDSRTLFSADLLVSGGTVVIPPTHGGSLTEYLDSLRRVVALRPARVLPAHGPEIEDIAGLVEHYIQHRRRREEQILHALDSGRRTVAALVEAIYENLSADLHAPAGESVLAHLIKLEQEGRVRRQAGDEWALA